MFDVLDMPWDWPVEINYHEAKAFCTWKGPDYRLPTEAEHHRMRGEGVVPNSGKFKNVIPLIFYIRLLLVQVLMYFTTRTFRQILT